MIDWHTHILPQLDDGSKSVKESVLLINDLQSQGVNTIIATPHFYANDGDVSSFIKRRNGSFAKLQNANNSDVRLLLGAEVRYYPGISRLEDLDKLQIDDSGLLLLEMPTAKWTEYMLHELEQLALLPNLKIVMAHVDRYLKIQPFQVFERLIESGILMQANAEFFIDFFSKRKALQLLRNGFIRFLGSDCHGIKIRPPVIGKAFGVIENKLGTDFVNYFNEYGRYMLKLNK